MPHCSDISNCTNSWNLIQFEQDCKLPASPPPLRIVPKCKSDRSLEIGAQNWITEPLEVLVEQSRKLIVNDDRSKKHITNDDSKDIARLIRAYRNRVEYAGAHGRQATDEKIRAIQFRARRQFSEAAKEIEKMTDYKSDLDAFRMHAASLHSDHERNTHQGITKLKIAIVEFLELEKLGGADHFDNLVSQIEAQIDLYEHGLEEGNGDAEILNSILTAVGRGQVEFPEGSFPEKWALFEFYKAEALQRTAEQIRPDEDHSPGEAPSGKITRLGQAKAS
jgi:hypothetical protein